MLVDNHYSYDSFNRLAVAEAENARQVNRYDAEGLRHELEENGELVKFIFSGKEVVVEEESDGNVIRYIRGLGLISSDSEKARNYYHYAADEMGSITHVVFHNESADPQVLNHYEYDSFGNTVVCEETVHNRFRYTGQMYDAVTSQYYLRSRFYNPVIGRFLQEDTYLGDGLNLFSYCQNNPLMYYDPSGNAGMVCPDKYAQWKKYKDQGYSPEEALKRTNADRAAAKASDNASELKVIGTYDNNNYFTRAVEFNAGSDGTGFTYKVFQRNDIDWNMVRTTGAKKGRGLTNAQAAEKYGLAPILNDGNVATLHHSQQRSVGPLFEASTRYHNISNAKKGPLHPYKGQLNPFNPMDSTTRGLFQKVDSIEYWKARGRDAMKGVQ